MRTCRDGLDHRTRTNALERSLGRWAGTPS
jgi:hypothetical protein